ncbi:MAG: permease-like cell division protein FtsX [Oscillospiraceae bacterium]|nr:permease-like cell division protein FtsX [Oscillospiraceae bacterium]
MRRFNLFYYIKQGFHGAGSHGFMTFASIGIMACCLLIMGSFSLLAINLEHNLAALMAENEFLAYVDDSYDDQTAQTLESEITAIENVASCTFISREEALANYVGELEDTSLYADVPASALRARFSVQVHDIEQLQATLDEVEAIEGVVKINAALDVADGFVTMRNVMVIIALVMVVILIIVSFFIISNAIKLATSSREREIAIMKMVGATNSFVRWPFVVEGLILGLGSSLVAMLAQWGVYQLLVEAVSVYSHVQLINIIPFEALASTVAIAFCGIGLFVGVLGSVTTIRKFLLV